MRKYAKTHNIKPGHNRVSTEYGKSVTVPSQSYTIKELVEMNKKGINPNILKKALYEMDDFGEELNPLRAKNFDLTDMDGIIKTVKAHQTKLEAEQKKQALVKKQKEREQIIEEYLKDKDKDKDGILDTSNPETVQD